MAVINCRSLNKNGIKLKDHIVEYDCDIVAVTETWLPCEDILANHIIGDVCPEGYKMSHTPPSSGHRGGEVGLIYKTSLDIRVPTTNEPPTMPKYKSFEYSHHLLKINSKWVRIVNTYRPPPSITNGLTTEKFFSEFEMFMEYVTTLPGQILILGDVNYHLEDTSNGQTRDFLELLDVLNLSQLVNQPTHRLGHTLDCIITEKNSNLVNNIQVYTPWISDHCLVAFNVSVQIPALCHKSITTRNWKSLNLDQLNSDIMDADFGNSSNSVSECVHHYDHTLHNLIDIHAPARNKTILLRPRAPWFTYDLSLEKRKKRRLERRYRNTGITEDALLFKEQSARYCQLLSTTRETFYNSKMVENAGDQKALFSVVNKLLHRKSETHLPAYDNLNELTNRFANFFINKIRNIRCELGDALPYKESEISTATSCELTVFSAVTTSDIQSLINKSNNKCCSLDPISTWLFKNCLPSLLPIVTNIVNQSLESIMPSSYKEAVLTPILKKPNMDPEVLKNYRPVSNLPYVSKLIEKIVAKQLTSYVHTNNLEEAMQSAYRANHSTETALCRLHNDIVSSLDRNECVLLVSLDLSAAFDTIDHQILLARLKRRFGITGKCLQWFSSYLVGRKLRVAINGSLSDSKDLDFGVPQGSVLGPKLFTMYLAPLGDIARGLGIDFHAYADDCQLYIAFSKENVSMIKYKMENLLVEIKKWMSSNMLNSTTIRLNYLQYKVHDVIQLIYSHLLLETK